MCCFDLQVPLALNTFVMRVGGSGPQPVAVHCDGARVSQGPLGHVAALDGAEVGHDRGASPSLIHDNTTAMAKGGAPQTNESRQWG